MDTVFQVGFEPSFQISRLPGGQSGSPGFKFNVVSCGATLNFNSGFRVWGTKHGRLWHRKVGTFVEPEYQSGVFPQPGQTGHGLKDVK